MGRTAGWLIDGMNVIGARPNGWWRDRAGAMRTLSRRVAAHQARTGEPMTVVFDGHRIPDLPAATGMTIRFAARPGPNAADDEIVAILSRASDPCAVRVVTSDVALARRVRAHGAQVIPAGAFLRDLDETAPG